MRETLVSALAAVPGLTADGVTPWLVRAFLEVGSCLCRWGWALLISACWASVSYSLCWTSAPCLLALVEQLSLLEAGDAMSAGQGMARESFFLPVSGDQKNHLTRAAWQQRGEAQSRTWAEHSSVCKQTGDGAKGRAQVFWFGVLF